MNAELFRQGNNVVAPLQPLDRQFAECSGIPSHSSLCHSQFLSLQSVPIASVSLLGFSPSWDAAAKRCLRSCWRASRSVHSRRQPLRRRCDSGPSNACPAVAPTTAADLAKDSGAATSRHPLPLPHGSQPWHASPWQPSCSVRRSTCSVLPNSATSESLRNPS